MTTSTAEEFDLSDDAIGLGRDAEVEAAASEEMISLDAENPPLVIDEAMRRRMARMFEKRVTLAYRQPRLDNTKTVAVCDDGAMYASRNGRTLQRVGVSETGEIVNVDRATRKALKKQLKKNIKAQMRENRK